MNSVVLLVLSLSLSASVISVLLLAFRPLYRDRFSKRWQYYIWLVVVLRLLVPFAPETNLMDAVFGTVGQQGQAAARQYNQEDAPAARNQAVGTDGAGAGSTGPTPAAPGQDGTAQPVPAAGPSPWQQFSGNLWLLWFLPALVLFVRSVSSYNSFLRYIRAGKEEVNSEAVLTAYQRACEDTGIRRPLPVYQNKLASSPMLVGVFRPAIFLPKLDMDVDGMQLVLRHELVHYKRRDLFYKWLVQLAVCIHWFNPLVYLASREIGKNCELSCDERVVANMPAGEKSRYGDTLLASVKTGGTYSSVVASVTLSEDAKNLKERLASILKSKPGSRLTKGVAGVCFLLLICGASYAGAYRGFAAAAGNTAITASPQTSGPAGREGLEGYVKDRISNSIQESLDAERIEDWASRWADAWSKEQADYWEKYWKNYVDQYPVDYWKDYAAQWSDYDTSRYAQDSWKNLAYQYEDGYLVGVGIKNFDSLDNYRRKETVSINGRTCTVAFAAGYESYAEDGKVMSLVQEILSDNFGGSWHSAGYYVVRSVLYNTDPEDFLRQLYSTRAFVEFMELVEHCGGLDVIEELLYLSADDGESMYFMFLSEQLPSGFSDGETLARKAVEKGDIIMLDAMEPFVSSTLYESLMNELLGLPDFS